MKTARLLWKMWLAGLMVSFAALAACDETGDAMTLTQLPPLAVGGSDGVSAPFAGHIAHCIVVAGGCNFPGTPAADGGAKVFYDQIFALDNPLGGQGEWKVVGKLPRPMAYGVSASVPQGVVCIGGNDGASSSDVWLLRMLDGAIVADTLQPLPLPLDNMAGAVDDGYIYVAGGVCNGAPQNKAFRLSLDSMGGEWEQLPDIPGLGRVQPVAAAHDGNFYLMGGYYPALADDTCTIHTDGLCYDPQQRQWTATAPLPAGQALIGATGGNVSNGRLVFAGGVDAERFRDALNRPLALRKAQAEGDTAALAQLQQDAAQYLRHPVEWYRFNSAMIFYDTATDSWITGPGYPQLARAGAAWVDCGTGTWIIIDGESKPGIRATDVTLLQQ